MVRIIIVKFREISRKLMESNCQILRKMVKVHGLNHKGTFIPKYVPFFHFTWNVYQRIMALIEMGVKD